MDGDGIYGKGDGLAEEGGLAAEARSPAHANSKPGGVVNELLSQATAKCAGWAAAVLVAIAVIFWYFSCGDCSDYEVAPKTPSNDPARSVYFGNGCFWHTQYDMFRVERDALGRKDADITSLVGYAGSKYTSEDGLVCYHGGPAGSLYEDLGHAEAVQVELTAGKEKDEYSALLDKYFGEGFVGADHDQRKDPGDRGAPYRIILGLPGGKTGPLYALLEARNVHSVPLLEGGADGGHGDTEDEGAVYVYDSAQFPFYRAERYHQFHVNSVLGRPVPSSYTGTLKQAQEKLGRIDPTGCPEGGAGF